MALQFDFAPDGGVQFSGNFQDLSFGKLLLWIARETYSGELSLTSPETKPQWLFFKDGQPVGVRGGPGEHYLGWLLVESGKIDEATCMASLQEMAQQKTLQGQVLKAMGVLHDADLQQALQLQLQRKLIRIFTLRQARFVFRSQARVSIQDVPPGKLNLYSLIGHGLRQLNDTQALREVLREAEPQAFRLKEETQFPTPLEEMPLDEDQINAIALLYDWTDITHFLQTGYLEPLPALVLLSIFFVCGFFEVGAKELIRTKSLSFDDLASPDFSAHPMFTEPPLSSNPNYPPAPSYTPASPPHSATPPVAKPSVPRPSTYQQASTLRPPNVPSTSTTRPASTGSENSANSPAARPSPARVSSTTPSHSVPSSTPPHVATTPAARPAAPKTTYSTPLVSPSANKPAPQRPPHTPLSPSASPVPSAPAPVPTTSRPVASTNLPPRPAAPAASVRSAPPAPASVPPIPPATAVISPSSPNVPPARIAATVVSPTSPPAPPIRPAASSPASAAVSPAAPPAPPAISPKNTSATGPSPRNTTTNDPKTSDNSASKPSSEARHDQQSTKIRPSKASELDVFIDESQLTPEDLELKNTIEAKLQQAADGANFYELLDVSRTADTKDIRASYRKLSRSFHPDRVAGSPLEPLRKKLDSFFAQLNEAHQILTRKTTRDDYDRNLKTPRKQAQHVENSVKAEEMYRMATVQIRRKDFKGALENLKWVCQISPDTGDYEADTFWCEYHLSPQKANTWKETIQKIEKTLEHEAEPDRVYFYVGEIYREQKQNKEAIEAFEKYLAAAPYSQKSDEVRQQLRILQHEIKKQHDAAIAERQKAKDAKEAAKKGGWGFGRK